jgi:Xaa-Pro aminopeptidase
MIHEGQQMRFSHDEYQRRHEMTKRWMERDDLAAVVIYATAYGGDNVRWLTGFRPRHVTYLIWPALGEPVLLTQLFNHVPNATRSAVIADVRWGGPDSSNTVVSVLREKGIDKGSIGLVGRVPYMDSERLQDSLSGVTWVNSGKGYGALRLKKSGEELNWLRKGAAYTDDAMAALVDTVAVGVTEHELAASIEGAYTSQGGDHGIHFFCSTPMATPHAYVPAQNQTARRLQAGDIVISELSAGVGGYAGQIHRPLTVGCGPTPLYQRIYEVALEAYEQIVGVLRPGATVKQVLDAADIIEERGLTVCDDLLHGYGMGYLPPVVRTRQTAHAGQPPEDFVFEENMAIVVQPNVYDPESGAGLQVGNLLVISSDGTELLQQYPMDFFVCGK